MDVAPSPCITPLEEKTIKDISESLKIIQNEKCYILNIDIQSNSITFNIKEDKSLINTYYIKKMSLEDINKLHKSFYGLNSCNEFLDFIKISIENKTLLIKEEEENILINIEVLYLFKKSNVEIILTQEKINSEKVVNEILKELLVIKEQLNNIEKKTENIENDNKEEINKLKEEILNLKNKNEENKKICDDIQDLKKEINNMKDLYEKNKKLEDEINTLKKEIKKNENKINFEQENKNIKLDIDKLYNYIEPMKSIVFGIYNKTYLMIGTDYDFLKNEIERKTKKIMKGIVKLYQATLDGGDCSIFHKKCDNVSNTLVLICSNSGRRFGGFTTETWDISGQYKDDRKSFLFSLDKRKIYSFKCNGKAIYCHKDFGPTFGSGFTIKIGKNAINEKLLYTYEYYPDGCSFNFNGDQSALSESGKGKATYIYAREYEVYKVQLEDIPLDFNIVY